jgi:hypothetical protein
VVGGWMIWPSDTSQIYSVDLCVDLLYRPSSFRTKHWRQYPHDVTVLEEPWLPSLAIVCTDNASIIFVTFRLFCFWKIVASTTCYLFFAVPLRNSKEFSGTETYKKS